MTLGVLTGLGAFVPSTARANDLSTSPCTAGDVEIIGSGFVLNEPCTCPIGGKFAALVQFTVRNNTSTGRYCIALHLVPDGTVITDPNGMDLILRDSGGSSTAPGKSGGASYQDTTMFATIPDFPCSVGQVCFGQSGVVRGKCSPGTCTTIAWNTSPNGADCTTPDQNPPGGQCRHQQVCIIGYGATLDCISGCTPTCGGTAVLRAGVAGGMPPYAYQLNGSDGSSVRYPSTVNLTTTDTSHDFTVTVTTDTTYTLTVTDSQGCTRTATKSLNASPLSTPTFISGKPDCPTGTPLKASTTLTATPSGLASYEWFDGVSSMGTSNPLTVALAPGSHSITVKVKNSAGCSATSSPQTVTVNPLISISGAAGKPDCGGNTILTATASGGAGGFTYEWFDGASSIGTGSPLTAKLAPGSHSLTVKATDSGGCSATSAPTTVNVNQPISISGAAGKPDCDGNTLLTATAGGGAGGFTYEWFDGGSSIGTGSPLTAKLAPGSHSLTVKATDSDGCSATSAPTTANVNQPVATTLNTGSTPDCKGNLTFTASATGGTSTYTFAWTIDGSPVAGVTGSTLAYPPGVDCNPHVIAVKATDSDGCPSGNTATRTATQVVSTTVK